MTAAELCAAATYRADRLAVPGFTAAAGLADGRRLLTLPREDHEID